jgi:eukaryotic-like serine/threonine-protein kinase
VVSAGVRGANPQTLQRFAREAKASSAINSAHVARMIDAGCDDKLGFPYIIMELLSGVDLSDVMKREGALAPEVAVRLVVQAARGIAAAHARGVVHRDIKPANLFLQQDPSSSEVTVKVCDFGVAKRVTSTMGGSFGASHHSLTRSGGMIGSPMYMSPEQARNAKAVDERTDVWSLSVVLWEALSGDRLWGKQASLGELIVAICTEPVKPLAALAPWVPKALAAVVHRGLERDPNKRTPTMLALIDDLDRFTGSSERIVTSQLVGLTESQRSELTLKINLSESAARRIAELSKPMPKKVVAEAISPPSSSAGSAHARARDIKSSPGSSKGAMLGVAVLSALVAGGSAYYFARAHSQPTPPAVAPSAPDLVTARIQISPADARVFTPSGAVPVASGFATVQGKPGETLSVTLQLGSASKTFSVSLGSDGTATPARLVISP